MAFQHRNPNDGTAEFIELIEGLQNQDDTQYRHDGGGDKDEGLGELGRVSNGGFEWRVEKAGVLPKGKVQPASDNGASELTFKARSEWADISVYRLKTTIHLFRRGARS